MISLLALIATFVVETNKDVRASGVIPAGAEVEYRCTGRKGQMVAGQSAELTLTGWQNVEIKRVTLSMRSNKASGAGMLTMHVDGREVWQIEESGFDQWAGSYSTEYQDIVQVFNPQINVDNGDISLRIEATENSLYIASYELLYEKAEARPYSVVLQTEKGVYATLTESDIAEGVVLPTLPNIEDWYFVGWAEQAVEESPKRPTLWQGGERFFPRSDDELWAVYSDVQGEEVNLLPRTDCQSGYYALAFPILNVAYAGAVQAGKIMAWDVGIKEVEGVGYERVFDITQEMMYYVEFQPDSMATIQHVNTATWVGYTREQLVDEPIAWRYRPLVDGTVAFFLDEEPEKVSLLWVDYDVQSETYVGKLVKHMNANRLMNQVLLYEVAMDEGVATYTSFPIRLALPIVRNGQEKEIVVPLGVYELRVSDGKKHLSLRK